jgi:hypothetical protein
MDGSWRRGELGQNRCLGLARSWASSSRATLGPVAEPWQTNASAPFLVIDGTDVAIWAQGKDRFRVTWPGGEKIVEGYDVTQALADERALSRKV